MPAQVDPWRVAGDVARVFDELGLRYSIGGSMASSVSGEPRSTLDVDIVLAIGDGDVAALMQKLGERYYVPAAALRQAVTDRTSANIIEIESSIKVDLFVAGGTPLDDQILARRLCIVVEGDTQALYVHTPEDVLLQKLRWFRRGGEASDRQWRDVLGLIRVQGPRLDRDYLDDGATRLGVRDLFERAVAQSGR